MHGTLHPDDPAEAASGSRLPVEVAAVDEQVKRQAVAVEGHAVKLFSGIDIEDRVAGDDLAEHGVQVALGAVRHETWV